MTIPEAARKTIREKIQGKIGRKELPIQNKYIDMLIALTGISYILESKQELYDFVQSSFSLEPRYFLNDPEREILSWDLPVQPIPLKEPTFKFVKVVPPAQKSGPMQGADGDEGYGYNDRREPIL